MEGLKAQNGKCEFWEDTVNKSTQAGLTEIKQEMWLCSTWV